MAVAADRYVLTGGPVPKIFRGRLADLMASYKEAKAASERFPGEHFVEAVYGADRVAIAVYENGECTWSARVKN
jgi:hypothetical protein